MFLGGAQATGQEIGMAVWNDNTAGKKTNFCAEHRLTISDKQS